MEWTAGVSAGDWVRDRLDDGPAWGSTMHGVVPHGFAAYARVFHPATRDRPVGVAWPLEPYDDHRREWEAFASSNPEIDTERVGWSVVAQAFGTERHALAQWHRLARQSEQGAGASPTDAAGWRYAEPQEGQLDLDVLAAIARILALHTTSPDEGFIGLWEGWGGVVGGMGWGQSRVLLTSDETRDAASARHDAFLATSARDTLNDVFRKPTWQPGALSDEISRGPRLELPARSHVLFSGGVTQLVDPDWVLRAPWRDRQREEYGFAPNAESPSLVWPADRAWVLVTEVDYDSTIVAGSAELVRALVADPAIEALPIREGADLTWDGDQVNR